MRGRVVRRRARPGQDELYIPFTLGTFARPARSTTERGLGDVLLKGSYVLPPLSVCGFLEGSTAIARGQADPSSSTPDRRRAR